MARVVDRRIVLAAASATAICTAQQPGAAGALTLNGSAVSSGVAVLDTGRRVLVTTTGTESGKTITVTGSDRRGNVIRETVALPNNSTVYTKQDFKTVTLVVISAAAAANISVGTNGVGSTDWVVLDTFNDALPTSVVVALNGVTANVDVELTLDPVGRYEVEAEVGQAFLPPTTFTPSGFTGLSADTLIALTQPVRALRLRVNSGATTGAVRMSVLQAG